jgi:hypothetical protein
MNDKFFCCLCLLFLSLAFFALQACGTGDGHAWDSDTGADVQVEDAPLEEVPDVPTDEILAEDVRIDETGDDPPAEDVSPEDPAGEEETGPSYTCFNSCRNGSEECDDQAFTVSSSPLILVCIDGNNGVAFIASNTGPQCTAAESCDGVHGNEGNDRCQGWEFCECEHAWDPGNQEKVASLVCTEPGLTLEVDLSDYIGETLWVGVHDNPDGGGHMNEVCIATPD